MMNYTWPEILLWDFLWEVTNYSFIFQFFFKEWRTLEHGWSFTFRPEHLNKNWFYHHGVKLNFFLMSNFKVTMLFKKWESIL